MAKIMKYCGSCEEGFAPKFTFCPDCGATLEAIEINPVSANSAVAAPLSADAPPAPEFIAAETGSEAEARNVLESENIANGGVAGNSSQAAVFSENGNGAAHSYVPERTESANGHYTRSEPMYADEPRAAKNFAPDAEDYSLTVIEEKNVKQRNYLLLASSFFILMLTVGATIISLFNKTLGVAAIGDERSLAYLLDEVPMTVEEDKELKKKDNGGGGGGGGRDEKDPTSQGDLADQSKTPTRPPDAKVFRSDNFELKTPPPQTEGTRTFEKKYNQWGDPNSKFLGLSNGTGTGGGQGSGSGTGQGSGSGTGTGSGTGSGSGDGNGNGNGDGDGPGGGRSEPPPRPTGVTTPFKLIAKPKANYTDEARTNNVQGTVRVKVALLATGQVGSITPVSRLPYGLTEQAIAAARQIRFEPKKVNGVPVPTIVTMEYTFTMY